MIIIHEAPQGEPLFTDYTVTVNNKKVQPYQCRVSAIPFNTMWPGRQRPIDQTEIAGFISLELSCDQEPAYVQLDFPDEFSQAVVRPLSKQIRVNKHGNSIYFGLLKTGHYTVEIDGHHRALHIFFNPANRFVPDHDNQNFIYFGAGIHYPGPIKLSSNQTLYVDAGAVVHTSITARNANNIRIIGYGIIDNSSFERTSYNVFGNPTSLQLFNCCNIEIEGVIFRDACNFTVTAFNCKNVVIDNVKTVGMWRYNSDGLDMVNSQNVVIRNCFLRNFDDVIVLKGFPPYDQLNVENILVTHCVIWCDWGNALEIGAETCAPCYRNIVFSECDVIHAAGTAIDVNSMGYGDVREITFENIRVEYSRYCSRPVYQKSMDMSYPEQTDIHVPFLMRCTVSKPYYDPFLPNFRLGNNHDIRFNHISAQIDDGIPTPKSSFSGFDQNSRTYDISIHNVQFNGVRAEGIEHANIAVGPFADQISWIE